MDADFKDIKIIVFDLDDTLYPERQFVKSGFHAVSVWLKGSGITQKELFPEMWRLFCEDARGTVFNNVLEGAGIEPAENVIKKLVDVYRAHKPTVSLYPDAEFVLNHFQGKKRLGMLTDGYLKAQENKVKALGIEGFFDIILFTDKMGRKFWKPNTAGYEKIMDSFGLSGNECLYIADNPKKDFYGALSLGWKTVQIKRADGIYRDEASTDTDCQADITVGDLYQLVTVVE
jgi:putative hydrolase of the HAD superfamily